MHPDTWRNLSNKMYWERSQQGTLQHECEFVKLKKQATALNNVRRKDAGFHGGAIRMSWLEAGFWRADRVSHWT